MNKAKHNGCPKCRKDTCFANNSGYCFALRDNNFNKDCPFYKERWEKQLEDLRCKARAAAFMEKRSLERRIKRLEQNTLDSG